MRSRSSFALFALVSRSLLIVCVSSSIAVPVVSIQLRVNVGTKQHSSTTVLISQESSVLHKQNPSMKVHIRICTAPHVNKHQKDLSNKLVLSKYAIRLFSTVFSFMHHMESLKPYQIVRDQII